MVGLSSIIIISNDDVECGVADADALERRTKLQGKYGGR